MAGQGVGDGHHLHPDGAGLRLPVPVLNWFSRRVMSWRLSITMEATLHRGAKGCVGASRQAGYLQHRSRLAVYEPGLHPRARQQRIAISTNGKGAWRDNVFVGRLWRSAKYEEVNLKDYDSVSEARRSMGRYSDFYNGRRLHSSLDGTTPPSSLLQRTAIPLGSLNPAATRKICSDNRDHLTAHLGA